MNEDQTSGEENCGSEEVTEDESLFGELDRRKFGCIAIVLVIVALIIILLLMRNCNGEFLGFGGDKTNVANVAYDINSIEIPSNCETVEGEDGKLQIVCDCEEENNETLEEMIRRVIVEEKCNPTPCVVKETATKTVPTPVKITPNKPKKKSCTTYAKKTGQPWQCLNPRNYRGYRGNRIKHNMCPGTFKCMIPGTKSKPTPDMTTIPSKKPKMVRMDITCEGKTCDEFYVSSILRKSGVKILTSGATNQGNGHVLVPRGVRTLTLEVPEDAKLEYVNAKDVNGKWAIGHENSKIVKGKEVTTPVFDISVKREGSKKKVITSSDAVKIKDWSGKLDKPNSIVGRANSDGAHDYTK